MLKFRNNGLNLFRFFFISSKSKYKRIAQPGLTRYNWNQQDFEEQSSDVYFLYIKNSNRDQNLLITLMLKN